MSKFRLYKPLWLSIGFRYAFAGGNHRFASFIAILSMLGITLGVAALIVVISVMNGLESSLKDKMLASIPHVVVTKPAGIAKDEIELSAFKHPLVTDVSAQIATEVIIQGKNEVSLVNLYGIDTKDYPRYDLVRNSIGNNRFEELQDGSYQLFIGSYLARKLGLAIGDKVRITVPSNVRYTPLGRVPVSRLFTVVQIYQIQVAEVEANSIFAAIGDVKKLAGAKNNTYPQVRVWLQDPFKVDEYLSFVKTLQPDLQILDWRIEKGAFFKSVSMEKLMMSIMLALIILVAIFNMLSALVMVVTSKISEIAILRTMGVTRKHIMWIFIIEGALSGIIGSILGTGVGIVAANNIDTIMSLLQINLYTEAGGLHLPCIINPWQVVTIILTTIVLSFLITIYPSVRAARLNPAASLRYE